jgi:hypothetical protein
VDCFAHTQGHKWVTWGYIATSWTPITPAPTSRRCCLGWQEPERQRERRALLRGEIDVQTWLNKHVPADAVLNEEAQTALAYLSKQALLDHTCYPRFRAEGLEVIGSGQIEGANKSVIGGRLNISGAHWSEEGAQGMVFVRAEYHSHRVLTDFHQVRHQAFPRAA